MYAYCKRDRWITGTSSEGNVKENKKSVLMIAEHFIKEGNLIILFFILCYFFK